MGVSILDIVLLLLGDSSTSLSSLKVLKMIRVVFWTNLEAACTLYLRGCK